MNSLADKNVLICINAKNNRVLFFNAFDDKQCEMIHSAKNIESAKEILSLEKIDYLVIECSSDFVRLPMDLHRLTGKYKGMKVVLLVTDRTSIKDSLLRQFQQIADVVLFTPLSALSTKESINILLGDKKEENKNKVIAKPKAIIKKIESTEDSQELWDLFFDNSLHAKIIIDSDSCNIIRVNQALLDLTGKNELDIVGQSWTIFDNKENYYKYKGYIKEITSKDSTLFNIELKKQNDFLKLKAEYQMGVLNGKIVFNGYIVSEDTNDVSNKISQHLKLINEIDILSANLDKGLDTIRKAINFDFLLFAEYSNNKLLKPAVSGNKSLIKDFFNNSLTILLSILKEKKEVELSDNIDNFPEYNMILRMNNLRSFCVYPIVHGNEIYGTIIAGAKKPMDSWHTTSALLSSLVNQCKLGLFHKRMVKQNKVEELKDKLTGLPNRNAMTNKLSMLIEAGISADKYIALMIIDIHKLNFFNKNIGVELTNNIIVNLSQIIVKTIRAKGQVYRLSGNEFLVLLRPHTDKRLVSLIAKELINRLNKPILLSNGKDAKMDFNIGVSIFPDDGQTVSSMMKNADLAMYDARLEGKNNFMVFKHSVTGQALKQKTEMEQNLKKAIEKDHIKVFFQPKINAVTEDIMGFEALVRWIDPEIGMINPGQFIPLAEETGLIRDLGDYITKRSCEKLLEWQQKYGLMLSCSINLSVVQLLEDNLPKKLESIINKSGVHPKYIDFEITETMDLSVVPNLVESLNKIVSIGCTLSIDDFGTGHSSLDYVKKIPAEYIKIDQSFVFNIGINPEDEAILDATISIAKRLNRKIIAEGVETEAQREYLLERGCEYFQGFLFSRPLPEEGVEKILKERVELMGTK